MTARNPLAKSAERMVQAGTLAAAVIGLVGGVVAALAGADTVSSICWIAVTLLGVLLATWWVITALIEHRVGVDLIALSALIGTLVVE